MRKLAVLAFMAILGGAWYVVHDVGHVPMFDAGLNRLAESEVEGYCAGQTFWANRGSPNPEAAADCRAGSSKSAEQDLTAVQAAFCRAVEDAGYTGPPCGQILASQKLWPTYDGGLSQLWSKSSPYPGDLVFVVPDSDSRTGQRDGFSRDDEPTATTTTTASTTTEGDG